MPTLAASGGRRTLFPVTNHHGGRFDEVQEQGEYIERNILEKYSTNDPARSANEQKFGDYYASCMDESAIESAGTRPLEADFNSINGLKSKQDLAQEIIRLHRGGVNVLFGFDSDQDLRTPRR